MHLVGATERGGGVPVPRQRHVDPGQNSRAVRPPRFGFFVGVSRPCPTRPAVSTAQFAEICFRSESRHVNPRYNRTHVLRQRRSTPYFFLLKGTLHLRRPKSYPTAGFALIGL